MAVLVVLLAAALFIGAASAAAIGDADFKNVTANATTLTAATGIQTSDILIYNTSVSVDLNNNKDMWINWGDDSTLTAANLNAAQGTGSYNLTVSHTYNAPGSYVVTLYNASTITATTESKRIATITVVDAKKIAAGEDAFVYEYIYVASATKLTKYSEGTNPTALNQIAGKNGVFYLTESVVNSQYGAYYYNGIPSSSNTDFIYIWYPELSIQAELTDPANVWGSTAGDSIEGKTINKNTNVTFLLNTPMVGPANVNNRFGSLSAKIVFTTPVGGKTTVFGTYDNGQPANYNNIALTATQNIVGSAIPGNDAAAGTYTAQAEFTNYKPFSDNAKKSNTISFTVQSTSLSLTAGKDSVVRSNPFTTTIQGDANTLYFIYVEGTDENQPYLLPGQSGFKPAYTVIPVTSSGAPISPAVNNNPVDVSGTPYYSYGYFETDASGKRTVQFNTQDNTDDKTYTIRIITIAGSYPSFTKGDDYDTVKVKVEKGSVTISASGDGSYYLGDEIKLTGTNTDSSYVFLFIDGPNLGYSDGVVLKNLPDQFPAYNATNPIDVKTDNTWEYKWDTSNIALDTGAYTIYATSKLTNGKASSAMKLTADLNSKYNVYGTVLDVKYPNDYYAVKLSDAEYATVSVSLKQPFLSANPSGTVVAKGDKIYIRGNAEGNPNSLYLYMFGPNYYEKYSVSVETDGSYEKKIEIPSSLASNQYFVVVQHPMYNGQFDAYEENGVFKIRNTTTGGSQQGSFVVTGANKLQGSQAADALTKMIDSSNIDDIYTKLTFNVEEAWIRINAVGDQATGTKFTISGTTNLAVDDQVLVEVKSSSFDVTDKSSTSMTSGVSQAVKVVKGDGTDNVWSVEIDSTNWKLDEYTVIASGIEADVSTTQNFNLVEKVVTPTPTATATGATPTTTTAPATTTPTQTPGFGAFVALAGLGAVALLVLRRN
ncbi:MEMAR_RS02690 family S-layer glycoprotein [Methanocorpusculum vombati]|uniref:PGF-CTERM sorting domain-containing protein n=1 Tax=Methanocorpusculum vombati TaxID=3002864 RepID=A0ABT4IPQ0_9EURY|nr:MEMAR_RS02690 family S-layer glycoprotein [Methanocorpusculum vombati]MCZ9319449.1 MEMAR_RS02690 family S-layer glycoprotein [Methanocorpusculum sp.]MCZ0863100.1 PGF-CTERM sorting domain-containing protein [Methanocorpusculum vombati]MDE2520376.1 MEMAR_RS02690 family S-layer glycoprotein [Methanocorpusculum sp.]MDE2534424.1 MEMAR_RS02690 family S-layer glycoprotein [Methanocorpusculum sp.]MDE2545790.1 MEMAR_RS02690 family S-layer glycoprotein [Methanocorpusculum sp.]